MSIQIEDILDVKVLSKYADLPTAIAAIGSTPTELWVTETANVTTSPTIHANTVVVFEGNGQFNVSAGQTLTISNMRDPGNKKVFAGTGTTTVKGYAVNEVNLAWWTGTGAPTVTANMWAGVVSYLNDNNSGVLFIPRGAYLTSGGVTLPSGTIVRGQGQHNGTFGSVIRLTSNSTYIFRVAGLSRNIAFRDVAFDCGTTTGSIGIELSDVAPNSIYNIAFDHCNFNVGTVGVDMRDTSANALEFMNVTFNQCIFANQTIACIRGNSANGLVTTDSCTFLPAPNGVSDGIQFNYGGGLVVRNCSFNGVNISPGAVHTDFTDASFNTTTGVFTTAAHSLPAAPGPHAVLLTTTGTLPSVFATNTVYYTRTVSATQFTLHRMAWHASNNILPITGGTAAGGGTHTLRTTIPIAAGRPRACVNTTQTIVNLTLIGNQAEGFPYFLMVSGPSDHDHPINLIGNITQGIVKLAASRVIVSIGNVYMSRGIEDIYGVSSDVYSTGDAFYTFAGVTYDAGSTPNSGETATLATFVGDSSVRVETSRTRGFTYKNFFQIILNEIFDNFAPTDPAAEISRTVNGVPLLAIGTQDNGVLTYKYTFSREPIGEDLPGWLKILSSDYGIANAFCGLYVPGGIKHSGRYINAHNDVITTAGGVGTVNCETSSRYVFTPTEDATLNATNVRDGQIVKIRITAGATSRTITFGTNFDAEGTLVTGTVAGNFTITFEAFGTTLYEMGRTALLT